MDATTTTANNNINPYSSSTKSSSFGLSSKIWSPRVIVQLLAILFVSILVAVATIVQQQHAALDTTSSAAKHNIKHEFASKKTSTKRSIQRNAKEMATLEKQLHSLGLEYQTLSNEVQQLSHGEIVVESITKDDLFDIALGDNDNEAWDDGDDDDENSQEEQSSENNEPNLNNDNADNIAQQQQQMQQHTPCTQEQCQDMFDILDLNGYFYAQDNFPTKGCFAKIPSDGNLYFGIRTSASAASPKEVIDIVNLPTGIERVWCDKDEVDNTNDNDGDVNNKDIDTEGGDDDDDADSSERKMQFIDNPHHPNFKAFKSNPNAHPKDRPPKKWWIEQHPPIFADLHLNAIGDGTNQGSIIPIDLSINHLQRIKRAPASPNKNYGGDYKNPIALREEFLPVVTVHDLDFRWRSKPRNDARPENIIQTTAYQLVIRLSNGGDVLLYDSGRVATPRGLPDVVHVSFDQLIIGTGGQQLVGVGAILEWSVKIWDSNEVVESVSKDGNVATSEWTKFAIGPSKPSDWKAKWISHPIDIESWSDTDASAFWGNNKQGYQDLACSNWEKRAQLPIFRMKIPALDAIEDVSEVASVLLVVSGLGSFRATLDGIPLSSSGPLDPPLTDFAQRVSYRGYDVTHFLTGRWAEKDHVIGISMGSGECDLQMFETFTAYGYKFNHTFLFILWARPHILRLVGSSTDSG